MTSVESIPPTDQSGSPSLFCDAAQATSLYWSPLTPPLPILEAFGGGPLHQYLSQGSFDMNRAVQENGNVLMRSHRSLAINWEILLFKFGPQAFLHAGD